MVTSFGWLGFLAGLVPRYCTEHSEVAVGGRSVLEKEALVALTLSVLQGSCSVGLRIPYLTHENTDSTGIIDVTHVLHSYGGDS